MKFVRPFAALGAIAALAALPAAALAHPAAYQNITRTATNEVQTITVTATGGTFLPDAGAAAVAWDATAAQVDASLEGLPTIDAGGVSVTKAGNVFTITYIGTEAATNQPQIVPDPASLTGGTATAATTTQGAAVATSMRYVFVNHGYSVVLNETNGRTDSGGIFYGGFPSALRAGQTGAQKLVIARGLSGAVTGAQVHATCDVASLNADSVIAAWQSGESDPFYDYIPFQSTAAGFDDDAADWIDDVQTATGVNLTGMSDTQAQTACTTTLGGTYRPADTKVANGIEGLAEQTIKAAVAPKDASIATLTGEQSALTAAKAAVDASLAETQAQLAKAVADAKRPLNLTPSAKRFGIGAAHLVTGEQGASVKLTVTVSAATAKSLGLKSTTLGTDALKLDAYGAGIAQPNFPATVRKALAKKRGTVKVVVTITAGAQKDTVPGTLIR